MTTKAISAKTINGHQYTGTYIPALEACSIGYKLASIFTGGTTNVSQLIDSKENNLILDVLSYTLRDGSAINQATFNNIYTGNLKELLGALAYALEANFADFLPVEGIGLLPAAVKARVMPVSQTQR